MTQIATGQGTSPVVLGNPMAALATSRTTANVSYSEALNVVAVAAGAIATITADRPTVWTLSGLGAIVSQSENSVIYSAPSNVAGANNIGGCEVLPLDSVFTTRIDTLPVHASSAQWIAQSVKVASVAISIGQSWGVNIVDNTVTPTLMSFYYTTLRNGSYYPLLTGNARTREGGSITTDGGTDHHMVTVNRESCHFYETYHDYLTGYDASQAYNANSGYDYTSSTYSQPVSASGGGTTDAAGLPLTPLTVHLSELQAGVINHALRFTSCAGCISSTPMWPAVGSTASVSTAAPMGSRWRLKSTFDTSTFSMETQTILIALQHYGMMLADIGGINQIQFDQDTNLDPNMPSVQAELQAAGVSQSDFDIIDESSLMVSPGSSQALGTNSSILTGSDSKGNMITVPIAVQPILIGVSTPVIYPQAGTSYTLPSWVNGTSNQNVNWTLTSGVGSVTAGVYTAPTSVNAPTAFSLTGVAAADPTNPVTVSGWALPSGAIRLDVGDPNPYTDSENNLWMADTMGLVSGSYTNDNETYPSTKWGGLADWFLYGWDKYTWGDDMQFGPFVVPNGTYNVTFMFAEPDCTGTFSATTTFDGGLVTGGPLGLEVDGVVTMFNVGEAVNNQCLTPTSASVPVTVTDGVLKIALRATGGENTHQAPFLSALQVLPVISETTDVSANDSDTCATVVNSASQLLYSGGGSGQTIFVNAGASCAWTADSDSAWLTVSAGASGMGNGGVTYTVDQNLSGSERSGAISIAGQSISVMQLSSSALVSPLIGSASLKNCQVQIHGEFPGGTLKRGVAVSFAISKLCQK